MKWVMVLATLLLSSFCCIAQSKAYSSLSQLARYDNILTHLKLDTLHGKVPVLYSKKYKVRAKALDTLVENCIRFYERKFPGTNFETQIVILDSAEWDKTFRGGQDRMPAYGMPNNNSLINKIFVAADKKAVARLFGQIDTLPDNVLSVFDNIVLHELGHVFLLKLKQTNLHESWANEFLASYFAICFLKEIGDKKGLPRVDLSGFQPHYKSLEDFEKFYDQMSGPNFAWYHGKFTKLGYSLYPDFKTDLLKKFIDNQSDKGEKLEPMALLKQLAPQKTNEWINEMK